MQRVDNLLAPEQDVTIRDLGPLSWVLEELRKSFDTSIKGLKRFVRESSAVDSDLAAADVSQLRSAKSHLHQVTGALRLLELEEAVALVNAMESAVNKFAHRPALVTEDAVSKLEYASFAVLEYLEAILAGKEVSSVGLFAQYSDINLLAGFDRSHPADLWIRKPFTWLNPSMPSIRSIEYAPEVRASIDAALLTMMQTGDVASSRELNQISLGLAESQTNDKAATFWKICAAFFEALAQKRIPVDLYAKRAFSGIVVHYNNLKYNDWVFSDKFMHNLLFFCDQAQIENASQSPCLSIVKKTWSLTTRQPVNYSKSHYGHFDPALLALSRKRITVAKELWTSLSSGDIQKIRGTSEQFKLVSESLLKLYPSSKPLAQALLNASDMVVVTKEAPRPELAMEVATAILYLEAVFEGWGSTDQEMEIRATKLALRMENVRNGGQSETVEPWIEELYRRVSDRESMGSVVGELRLCLTDIEKSIDLYFRNPSDQKVLQSVPSKLSQMRGIFSVLGLDQAASVVVNMRDRVEEFELLNFDFEAARISGQIDKFGNNLGALGFLIDMLNYQPALVKKLFVYDSKTGDLSPLMGRETKQIESFVSESPALELSPSATSIPVIDEIKLPVPTPVVVAPEAVPIPAAATTQSAAILLTEPIVPIAAITPVAQAQEVLLTLPAVPVTVSAVPAPQLSKPVVPVTTAPVLAETPTLVPAVAFASVENPASVVLPTTATNQTPSAKILTADELELRSIFLEEAAEVVVTGLNASQSMMQHPEKPENFELQSTLRRAFHTLKGSARMVGLDEFGEAGWAFEQLVNTKLADQKPFEEDFCKLAIIALQSFQQWAKDIESNSDQHWKAETFRHAADAMRIDNRFDVTGFLKSDIQPMPELEIENVQVEDESLIKSIEAVESIKFPDSSAKALVEPIPVITTKPEATKEKSNPVEATAESKSNLPDLNFNSDVSVHSVGSKALAQSETIKQDAKAGDWSTPVAVVEQEQEKEKKSAKKNDSTVVELKPVVDSTKYEEQFKIIGSLKIGIPLYNVYLNEADEWSRCLVTELDEWALELHRPLLQTTTNYAHSLAGSSATVGFTQLSGLAKILEHALEKASKYSQGYADQSKLFVTAAEECRRLLHQFAAGFLVEPKASIVQELELFNSKVDKSEITPVSEQINNFKIEAKQESIDKPKLVVDKINANISSASISDSGNLSSQIPGDKLSSNQKDNDDDIELVDSLDIDLFHIFEEEAQELLPNLGKDMRQWSANPEDLSARSEILRTLHTLKGSARLAGAMRLGELSHRMESEIEALGSEDLTTSILEPLTVRLESLQQNFESLRHPSEMLEEANNFIDAKPSIIDTPEASVSEIQLAKVVSKSEGSKSSKSMVKPPASSILKSDKKESRQSVRVRARLLDRLVNQAGEVMLTRTRIESELGQLRGSLGDLTGNLDRLRQQLRDVEFQAETQMQSRMEQSKDSQKGFDPLEFDRFTRVQELTRMMAESVNDVATVQRSLQRTVDLTEDDLVAQARQTRDLQRDLLRTRMEEFESISDRLYRVVRQASKDTSKQVKLDIVGGSIEIDRGVLERMTPSFEHLLRNCVAHGLESAEKRVEAGKDIVGAIAISLLQDGNDVVIEFSDDGGGLNYQRIREQAIAQKIIDKKNNLSDAETINLIFTPGLSTASKVTELAGRGIGLDVVRSEIIALGGRIDVSSEPNKGSRFKLVLPLTTAVTQVVMMRSGNLSFGVPSHLVEIVRRAPLTDVEHAYTNSYWGDAGDNIPFYWSGALLQASQSSSEALAKSNPIVIFRSAGQRIAMHVDEIFGNKEVVIKNLGPQLARLPGLAGMAILVSGAVALIYNPVALASVYGATVQQFSPTRPREAQQAGGVIAPTLTSAELQTPLILVVDDSITVRRVTQRMLQREGFRVVLAVDGLHAIEKLNIEIPAVVLSDIEMPRMDGFDLVRNIRADAKLKHLPVVMITSRIADKHRELAMELGVNDYLGKPYSEEGLLTVLRQHTAKKVAQVEEVKV
jgi:chemosensory pili system protein ChpA (sensor histidine kinase/response regulator)